MTEEKSKAPTGTAEAITSLVETLEQQVPEEQKPFLYYSEKIIDPHQ